jgi:serine/threonine protein kinase
MTPARASVKPGDLLGDKYRVERVLGLGGMGVVVAATHTTLDQLVAIKVMLPEALADPDAAERLLREARAAGRLRSEHTVAVKDVGTFGDMPYIVMEHLEGTDLERAIHEGGPLPSRVAADYLLQACLALAEAHGLGIVHRDLKPANLFLTHRPDGRPLIKVLDFGISKMAHEATGLTKTAVVMGSANYMSPEQIRSAKSADARSDIWSLGITLHELVTGHVPFDGESFLDVCVAIARDPAPTVAIPGLDAVILGCLE